MSAAICMSAIGDPEDSFPTRPNLRTVMPEDQDQDVMPTDAAPPLSEERKTEPPGPDDDAASAASATMLPGAPPLPREGSAGNPLPRATQGESYMAGAARDFSAALVEMRGTRADIANGFKQQDKQARATRREVAKAARQNAANYKLVHAEVIGLKDSFGTFRRETEEWKASVEKTIEDLKEKIAKQEEMLSTTKKLAERLEKELERARVAAPASPPPAVKA